MKIAKFEEFNNHIFWDNAKELVKHVFLRTTLRMNEHKIHDVAVSMLW